MIHPVFANFCRNSLTKQNKKIMPYRYQRPSYLGWRSFYNKISGKGENMEQHINFLRHKPTREPWIFQVCTDALRKNMDFTGERWTLYFEDGTRARFLGFNIATRSNTLRS